MADIRLLNSADLVELAALENCCFSSPWSFAQIARHLEHKRGVSLGLFHHQNLIGFAFFSFILDEAELLQIATAPQQRNKGAAKALLIEGVKLLTKAAVVKLMLEVRVSNAGAIGLYQSQGFVEDGRRKGYYKALKPGEGPEDALLMSKNLIGISNAGE